MSAGAGSAERAARRAFVHVGLPKTGTSYLQSVMWQSGEALADQGLTLLPGPVGVRSSTELMRAVRHRLAPDLDPRSPAEVLRGLARQAAGAGDLLVSQEQLAAAGPVQVSRLWRALGEHEVHVVVTARSLARQIPSGWQERVKTRARTSYADFVEAVAARDAGGRDFWRYQDLPDVLSRWGGELPPERVHVVTVPRSAPSPELLLSRYCGVLGVDPGRLRTEVTRSNSSLGFPQAEVLRRVNVALGDRLPSPRRGYSPTVKGHLGLRVLLPQGGRPPLLPREYAEWCREVCTDWVAVVAARGYSVAGDLDDLLPGPDQVGGGLDVSEEAVADSSIRALADLMVDMVDRLADQRRAAELTARVAELEATVAELQSWSWGRWLGRSLGSRARRLLPRGGS